MPPHAAPNLEPPMAHVAQHIRRPLESEDRSVRTSRSNTRQAPSDSSPPPPAVHTTPDAPQKSPAPTSTTHARESDRAIHVAPRRRCADEDPHWAPAHQPAPTPPSALLGRSGTHGRDRASQHREHLASGMRTQREWRLESRGVAVHESTSAPFYVTGPCSCLHDAAASNTQRAHPQIKNRNLTDLLTCSALFARFREISRLDRCLATRLQQGNRAAAATYPHTKCECPPQFPARKAICTQSHHNQAIPLHIRTSRAASFRQNVSTRADFAHQARHACTSATP